MQYGESFLCGNGCGRYGAAPAGACNYACTGNRGQACGGAGNCWSTSPTFVEQREGGGWRAVSNRRGSSNVFDTVYTRGSESGRDVLTLDRLGSSEIRVKRNGNGSVLGSTIGPDGVARGMYDGATRFTRTCGGQ